MKDRTAQLLLPPGDFHDLETLIRGRVREIIDQVLDEELASGLGASSYERVSDRKGYRHGHRPPRKLLTSFWAISSTKNAPIYLDRPRSVEHSIVVTLPEGFTPTALPEGLKGHVSVNWRRDGNRILATRLMSLPKLQVEAASVADLSKILDEWNACANQKVAVGQ